MCRKFDFRASLLAAVAALVLGGCAGGTQPPQVSYDGLELQPDTRLSQVYVRPGASLEGYAHFGLVPCEVAFRKNWQRDQNTNRTSLTNRVTQRDIDRIKQALSAECDKYFRAALEQAPPYNLVESFQEGEAVLILRPSIIDLDINAPDIMSPGINRSYTTSAGEATLFLEALDATTGEILVRVVDRRRQSDTGYLQWTNSVTNRAEAERALRYWSSQLRQGLDRATGHAQQ